ncbi:AMP-binding protein [Altibacter sp. HG106]|uniref:AMP-binding protein n=1 Tax=Altibacter sp. HG106 TaxID=3023937 RepID=UPI0023509F54|nr:AMP-binding protein [Altibacter sp. HG106]MDC7993921.1 AMP-binding protein [Altibacter sp. HG106]
MPTPTSPFLHSAFTLNGLSFETVEELVAFADSLVSDGHEYEVSVGLFLKEWFGVEKDIQLITSGSTGKPKKIRVPKSALINSAIATGTFFKIQEGKSALLCLSADYIAGKMMVVRALTLGWDLHIVAPTKDALVEYDNSYDFVAMVPLQVQHSLEAMSKVKKVIVGGAPISASLEEALQDVDCEVFATYGMTETVSHIAIRRVNGLAQSSVYSGLPGVTFATDDRDCLIIHAPGIAEDTVITNDIVSLKSPTSFEFLGRYDHVINSGGVKIFPEHIEHALSAAIAEPFIITSEPDEALGQKVILVIESGGASLSNYSEAIAQLPPYERPKKVYSLSRFPRTETGKIKRKEIGAILKGYA